jgi:hypothetical protein
MQAPRERVSIAPTRYNGVSRQHHHPAALYAQGLTPGTHCIGVWVGLRTGLKTEAREKFFGHAKDETVVVQSVVRATPSFK